MLCPAEHIKTYTHIHVQKPASRGDSRMTNDKVTNMSLGTRAAGIESSARLEKTQIPHHTNTNRQGKGTV